MDSQRDPKIETKARKKTKNLEEPDHIKKFSDLSESDVSYYKQSFISLNRVNQYFNYGEAEASFFKEDKKSPQSSTRHTDEAFFYLANLIKHNMKAPEKGNDQYVLKKAYEFLVIFGGKKSHQEMLEHIAKLSNQFTSFDDCVKFISLEPNTANIDLKKWRMIINKEKTPKEAISLFFNANKIKTKGRHDPESLEEAREIDLMIALQESHPRWQENIKLAKLCLRFHVDNDTFVKCLDLRIKYKLKDNLPDMHIDGSAIDKQYSSYSMIKLSANDPVALILGKIIMCCQSINAQGERFARAAVEDEDCAIIVLVRSLKKSTPPLQSGREINFEEYEIVGGAFVWKSHLSDAIVLDSWEGLRPEDDELAFLMVCKLSDKMIEDKATHRVMLGLGGKTPNLFTHFKSEKLESGFNSQDSTEQAELAVNQMVIDLAKQRFDELDNLFPSLDLSYIVNIEQNMMVKVVPILDELLNYPAYSTWIPSIDDAILKDFSGQLNSMVRYPVTFNVGKELLKKLSESKLFDADILSLVFQNFYSFCANTSRLDQILHLNNMNKELLSFLIMNLRDVETNFDFLMQVSPFLSRKETAFKIFTECQSIENMNFAIKELLGHQIKINDAMLIILSTNIDDYDNVVDRLKFLNERGLLDDNLLASIKPENFLSATKQFIKKM